jgi:transcriptional regulator with XRE-family HTH domain
MASKKVREAIRKAVKESGYTHIKFAKKIGVGATMVSQWVSGARNPSLKNLQKISKATGVPLNFFLENSIRDVKGTNFSINSVGQGNINISKDIELLKKENELLKRELEIVKREKELGKSLKK